MPDLLHQPHEHSAAKHLLQQWKSKIIKGNAFYDKKDWNSALKLYKKSLRTAKQLLDQHSDNSLHAYIISRHNLASLFNQAPAVSHEPSIAITSAH